MANLTTSLQSTIVSSGTFDGFPGIATYGPNNKYLVVTYMHSAVGDPNTDGLAKYVTSTDGGNTWSAPATMFTPPGSFHAQDTNVVQLRRDGSLLATGFIESNSGSPTQGQCYSLSGTVSGSTITWGSPNYIGPLFPSTPNGDGFCTDKALELPNGNLLLAAYATQNGGTTYSAGVYQGVWTGSGFTWSALSTIAAGTSGEQYNETGLVQLPNGNILAMIRHDISATQKGYSQSISTDGGNTWSALTQTLTGSVSSPFQARPALAITSSGVVVFSSAGASYNTTAWTSTDNGNTWSAGLQLGSYSEYNSMVVLGNGTIAVASGIASTPNTVSSLFLNFLYTGYSSINRKPPAYVQSNFGGTTGSTTSTVSFLSNNTAGNLLVIEGRGFASNNWLPSIADSQVNNWTIVQKIAPSTQVVCFFAYAQNCKAGANTITVTSSIGNFVQAQWVIAEYFTDKYPIDTVASAYATGTGTTLTANSITPTSAGELLIIAGSNETSGNPGYTPQAGFTGRQLGNNPFIADNVNGASGAQSLTVTSGVSVTWEVFAIAFLGFLPTTTTSHQQLRLRREG